MVDYVQIVSAVGFPIAVTGYLLLRFEKIMIANTEATNELSVMIAGCPKRKKS